MWAVCISRLSAPLCPQCWQRLTGAVGQTKLYHKQRYQSQKKDTNKKFFDKGDGRAGVRIKGEVKRGGTEKMKKRQKERERLQFQCVPCRHLFRHQPTHFQKGLVKEGASCPQPTGVINLETRLLYVI